ncbi:aldo/keto reductase [Dactylosporangium fulvum]|uniref:Aldo/keto reductase n=1 Tax=Dactylosporangium fulvum TaxID=53359 RepID=A0ABY5VSJ6_9ACTN|nr:aldo/keto reductase [Dactylosporangium fulvum]UWP79784.1 aldo/keto reductase [Dactylosporangium fulvum]
MTALRRLPIGRTDVLVTDLGLGAAPLGNRYTRMSDKAATALVDEAWQQGIRFFDTAPQYGLGLSERRLGAALARHDRADYVIASKVGRLLVPNRNPTGSALTSTVFDVPDDVEQQPDYSRDGVRRSVAASLERLGTDRLDIALVHDPDRHLEQCAAEALPALAELRAEGLVGAIGVAMNQWQAPLDLVRKTELDCVLVAGRWTLLDRSALPLLDECAERGVSVLAAAPFNSGLLSTDRPQPGARFNYRASDPALIELTASLAAACTRFGTTLPSAALRFPLSHPAVASVVVGQNSAAQVTANAHAFAGNLPETLTAELSRLIGDGPA